MEKQAVLDPEEKQLAIPTPMRLIEMAMSQGLDAEKLGKLMELQFQWEDRRRRDSWISALQAFKANPPDINKTKKVEFANSKGANTVYHHAQLDIVNDILRPALGKHGLTLEWKTADSNGRITVSAVLTHAEGHSEEISTLSGPADTSGGKNNVQAIGSTTTYLQRYTALAGLGLVSKGQDDDGKTEGMPENVIDEWLTSIGDSMNLVELQRNFGAAWTAAKNVNDVQAQTVFMQAKDSRKKELA
jgi:hypothetical protein